MARFTFVLPQLSLNGGIRVVASYGAELLRLGHDVHFVARRTPPARLRDVLRGRTGLSFGGTGPLDFFRGMEDKVRFLPARGPLRAADLPDADFLIATWWETVEWVAPLPASKGRQVHLMQGYEMFDWLDADRVAATYEADLTRIAVSGWIARQVEAHHGTRSAAVIPNAVDTDHFAYRPETGNAVLKLGFVYSSPKFKNAALVFDLKQRLAARGQKVDFLCFSAEDDTRVLAGHPNIAVHHRPDQSLIPTLYQSCDLWLFPSIEEGFGLPILEALSCGTPVISSKAGAGPDLIETGRNGYLCDADAAQFADAVAQFSRLDPVAQLAMRAAARRTAERHTWTEVAGTFLTALGVDAATASVSRA